jgi:hypothetical protein
MVSRRTIVMSLVVVAMAFSSCATPPADQPPARAGLVAAAIRDLHRQRFPEGGVFTINRTSSAVPEEVLLSAARLVSAHAVTVTEIAECPPAEDCSFGGRVAHYAVAGLQIEQNNGTITLEVSYPIARNPAASYPRVDNRIGSLGLERWGIRAVRDEGSWKVVESRILTTR